MAAAPERTRRSASLQPRTANRAPLPNRVHRADCIKFLQKLPDNVFDLCFADPPYNLEKNYTRYADALADRNVA